MITQALLDKALEQAKTQALKTPAIYVVSTRHVGQWQTITAGGFFKQGAAS